MVSSNTPAISRTSVIWALAAVAAAPVIVFAANGMVILLALLALSVTNFAAIRDELRHIVATPIGIALAGLVLWMIIGLWWTPEPVDAVEKIARLSLLWLAGIIAVVSARQMKPEILRYAGWAIPGVMFLALLFYALELASSGAIIGTVTGLNELDLTHIADAAQREAARLNMKFNAIGRGASLLAIFIWPAIAILLMNRTRSWRAGGVLVITCITLLALPMAAAPLALLAGGIAWIIGYVAPRFGPQILAATALMVLVAMPFAARYVSEPETLGLNASTVPISWQHRIGIWHFVSERIAEKPVLGWGIDASRFIKGGNEQIELTLPDGTKFRHASGNKLPLHPHSGPMQIWLELGLPGVVFAAIFLLGLARLIAAPANNVYARETKIGVAMASASAATAISLACISFGLWQNWWQASFWLAAVLVTLALRHQSSATR